MRKYYVGNVGEIMQQIRESVQEFKPVIGDNVQSDNKKTNDKSYKDIEKAVKNFDGGLQEPKKNKLEAKTDGNKTTLDYTLRMPASKEFKDKVKAQKEKAKAAEAAQKKKVQDKKNAVNELLKW